MPVNNNRDMLEEIFRFYLSVKDGEEKKWDKYFFYNILSNHNNYFFYNNIEKGYLIVSSTNEDMDIIALAIDKKSRRNGGASKLLNELIEFAKKKKILRITLEVSLENKAAIKLYKKFGFLKIGIRKNYYKIENKMVDAFLMRNNISSP